MADDQTTTVSQLKTLVASFRDERDWKQFHNPKDLAAAIAIEAGELQELFLWKGDSDVELAFQDPAYKKKIEDELADIFNFGLSLADSLDIDVSEAIRSKIKKNAAKYPADTVRGKSNKYSDYR